MARYLKYSWKDCPVVEEAGRAEGQEGPPTFLHILYNQAFCLLLFTHFLISPKGALSSGPISHRLNAPGKSHGSPNRELGADPTYLHILYHRIGVCPVYNYIGHDTSMGRKTEVKGTDIGNSFPSNRIHASFVSWERTVPSTGDLPGFVYHTLFT